MGLEIWNVPSADRFDQKSSLIYCILNSEFKSSGDMKPLQPTSGLTERVYSAILDEILDGRLPAGAHLVQEQLAVSLGVSRQPIQQAMALLKSDGVVEEIGTRGLRVTALDLDRMHDHYDLRALQEGYAARTAARYVLDGQSSTDQLASQFRKTLEAGNNAVDAGVTRDQIAHDEIFHKLIYQASRNSVLLEAAEPHWRYLRRAMADVLRHAEPPSEIWQQHAAIADAILSGDPDAAERLATEHVRVAATLLSKALTDEGRDRHGSAEAL